VPGGEEMKISILKKWLIVVIIICLILFFGCIQLLANDCHSSNSGLFRIHQENPFSFSRAVVTTLGSWFGYRFTANVGCGMDEIEYFWEPNNI